MGIIQNITGQKFNKLTVLSRSYVNSSKKILWKCRCDCGNTIDVVGDYLKSGDKKHCGCERKQIDPTRKGKEYSVWRDMLQRCKNPKCANFKYYGAKGISVCDRWKSFDNFLLDMGFIPKTGYTIDRIDVKGNYEPKNCRWADRITQDGNRSNNRIFSYKGVDKPFFMWCKDLGVKPQTFRDYLKRHSFDDGYKRYANNKLNG